MPSTSVWLISAAPGPAQPCTAVDTCLTCRAERKIPHALSPAEYRSLVACRYTPADRGLFAESGGYWTQQPLTGLCRRISPFIETTKTASGHLSRAPRAAVPLRSRPFSPSAEYALDIRVFQPPPLLFFSRGEDDAKNRSYPKPRATYNGGLRLFVAYLATMTIHRSFESGITAL